VLQPLLNYIRERQLIRAGERIGIAVSGGADSVALLRAMLELRDELGVVLSVVHFNHGIRGAEADADAQFVARLSKEHRLPINQSSGDVPFFAKKWKLSTEAAARRLRYELFRTVIADGSVHKIATAHTRDDQAETVLLRLIRGAGSRGLGGIHPVLKVDDGAIIRPMLEVSRQEVESYLKSIGQSWREDSTNTDIKSSRNRVRHQLLPLLERDYNANIREVLSEAAEVARDEDALLAELTDRVAKDAIQLQDKSAVVLLSESQSVALQRRLLRLAAERLGLQLDFQHSQQVLGLLRKNKGIEIELPNGWLARRIDTDDVELARAENTQPSDYEYAVTIPGEVQIVPVRTLVRLTIVRGEQSREMYNPASLLDASRLSQPLVLRNWRPGDRMQPLNRGSEEKLKRLFQEKKIPASDRPHWPVLVSSDRIVWVKDLGVASDFAAVQDAEAVMVEVQGMQNS